MKQGKKVEPAVLLVCLVDSLSDSNFTIRTIGKKE